MPSDGNNLQPEIITPTGDDLWQTVQVTPGFAGQHILDLRPRESFAAGHLPGSVNISPPPGAGDAVGHWLPSVLLPPRESPLLIIDDDPARLQLVCGELTGRGRTGLTAVLLPKAWPSPVAAGKLEYGPGRGHLWRPDPWLSRHQDMLPPTVAGPALDLACGSGRASVWLALRGFAATGVDHLPDALVLGRCLAAVHGVKCDFQAADLRDLSVIPAGPWAVMTIFRYLQRDLLDYCLNLLRPGGVMLVRTFLDRPGWDGKPARRFRLRCGELPGYFPSPEFTILAYEESDDPDGRPAAGIVVRREANP